MKRVLVTGATGFVGGTLIERLGESGYCGIATGRRRPESTPVGLEFAARDDVLTGHVSITEIDAIVHLEVKHHAINLDQRTLAEIDTVNVGGTRDWLAWASARNIPRFVFASSVKAVRAEAGSTFETAIAEASDPYGRSKARAEDAVRAWVAADARREAIILRFAPVYGPGNTANLADFAHQVLRGRPCFVGQGQTRKSVVSLRNATAAIEWALQTDVVGCEVFNVSDPTTYSISELATMIATAGGAPRPRGVPAPVARLGALAGNFAGWILKSPALLNSRRLAAMLETTVFPPDKLVARGFVHAQSTAEGIRELVAWLPNTANERNHDRSRTPP